MGWGIGTRNSHFIFCPKGSLAYNETWKKGKIFETLKVGGNVNDDDNRGKARSKLRSNLIELLQIDITICRDEAVNVFQT